MLQLFNPEWLPRVTGSHEEHYRHGSAENRQYVLFLLLPFPHSLKHETFKR